MPIARDLKIVIASWAPFVGGAEVACERLAIGLRDAGHNPTIVVGTNGAAQARFEATGIPVTYIPHHFTDKWHWLRYRRSLNQLKSHLNLERPDLVHCNDLPTSQLVADAARRVGLPCVCHHRWVFEGSAIDWLNKFGSDRHLFVSSYLRDYLHAKSSRLAQSPSAVVHDGLELPRLPSEADKHDARSALGLEANPVQVLFAGQVIPRKGVADLLRAWQLIEGDMTQDCRLTIVGDDVENRGSYRIDMEKLARSLNLKHVWFVGFQSNVPSWITASDLVLVPSHTEPLGNATLEAMAHGRPVVGCRVGGIPEMITHDVSGILVEPENPTELSQAMRRLIENEQLRRVLGASARRDCELRFGLHTHVDQVVAQYEHVLVANRRNE